MNILKAVVRELHRATIPSHRWDRLAKRLRDEGIDDTVARGLVRDELCFQERAFGAALRVPTWALALSPGKPAAVAATVAPASLKRGHSAKEADLEALRRLVIYVDRHRGERYSVIARKWAVGGPGEAWADEALRRLAAAGILAKRRGTGRANAPSWQFTCSLDEALRRLYGLH
jgi:hypothetical protein